MASAKSFTPADELVLGQLVANGILRTDGRSAAVDHSWLTDRGSESRVGCFGGAHCGTFQPCGPEMCNGVGYSLLQQKIVDDDRRKQDSVLRDETTAAAALATAYLYHQRYWGTGVGWPSNGFEQLPLASMKPEAASHRDRLLASDGRHQPRGETLSAAVCAVTLVIHHGMFVIRLHSRQRSKRHHVVVCSVWPTPEQAAAVGSTGEVHARGGRRFQPY